MLCTCWAPPSFKSEGVQVIWETVGRGKKVFSDCDIRIRETYGMKGVVKVRNKPERVQSDKELVEKYLHSGALRPAEARSLVGRLLYARSNTFGRCGAVAIKAISRRANERGGVSSLDEDLTRALRW